MVRLPVLVADAHELVRIGVRSVLGTCESVEIVGEAHDGPTTLIMSERLHPALVVAELSLPRMTGSQVIERLTSQQRAVRVLVHTTRTDEGSVRSAFAAGALGYVLKQSSTTTLLEGVRALLRGDAYVDPQLPTSFRISRSHSTLGGASDLSPREQRILALVALGYGNKEIAARVSVSVKTVETYRARAAEKLGLTTRADFVRYAIQQGLLNDALLAT